MWFLIDEPLNIRFKEEIEVLNYCTLYTTYYTYIAKLKGDNKHDLYACEVEIKML